MHKTIESICGNARRANLAALACIVLLGALLYGHTLDVPWYLDDNSAILEEKSVHSVQEAAGKPFSGRWLANITLAVNYTLGGRDVTGYHLVNIAIHLATACLVFLLFRRVFRDRVWLALTGALIFVAHPLQTQAVTYIVQRMTSMAGLFFFLALYLYVRGRECAADSPRLHWVFYAAALSSGALAVFSKQNAAVLPLALLLFDRYFLPRAQSLNWRRLLPYLLPFCVVPLLLAAQSLLMPMLVQGSIDDVGAMPDLVHLRNSSPMNYLFTQFSVIWIYLRLLFIPYGQALDYDVPIVATLFAWKNIIAFAGVALLFAAAAFLRERRPLISAGVFWFFLGLAVESSIIPLDPVFEHRLYVPMFGFALVLLDPISRLSGRAAVATALVVTSVLGVLTWQRNALWRDPVAFFEDNLRRAPRSERMHIELANRYMEQGRAAEAQVLYERALQINPGYVLVHINLSRALTAQKEYRKAVAVLLDAMRKDGSYFQLYNNLGVLYSHLGEYANAAAVLRKAAMLEPDHATLHLNLGLNYDKLQQGELAIWHYRRSIALDNSDPLSHFHLGSALHRKGDRQGALNEFLVASRLNPNHVGTLYNASLILIELGNFSGARSVMAQLQRLDPDGAAQLERRIARAAN